MSSKDNGKPSNQPETCGQCKRAKKIGGHYYCQYYEMWVASNTPSCEYGEKK